MNPTSIPILALSVKLKANTAKHLALGYGGSLPAAGGAIIGTTERPANKDEQVAVTVLGKAIGTSAAAIAAGAALKVTAEGKLVTHSGDDTVVGRAITAASAADKEFEYICIPN